jgi:phage terminase large subunit-like protein
VRHHAPNGVEDGIYLLFKPYSQGVSAGRATRFTASGSMKKPPYAIYSEGLTRTNKYGQFSLLTFTPLMRIIAGR